MARRVPYQAYKEVSVSIPAPTKGINMTVAIDKLLVDEAIDIRGYEFAEYGVLAMPFGDTDIGDVAAGTEAAVLSAHIFQRPGLPPQLLVHLANGALRVSNDFHTAPGSPPAVWATEHSGLSTTQRMSFVTFDHAVWMSNGVDDYAKWDGATYTTFPALPKMRYLAVWKEMIWGGYEGVDSYNLAGDTDPHPDRVRNCIPGDGETWPDVNFVDIDRGTGLGISSIQPEVNELVVFKYLNTHGIYDPIEYTNRLVDSDKGSISHWATCTHNGKIYFMSHMGICVYDGTDPSPIISEKIAPLFEDIRLAADTAQPIRLWAEEPSTWACSFENHIDFRIPMFSSESLDTASNFQVYPDYPDRPWLRSGPDGQFAVVVREIGMPAIQYVLRDHTLYRCYSDPVTAGKGRWWTSWQNFDAPLDEKYLYLVTPLARGIFDLAVFTNYHNVAFSGIFPNNAAEDAGDSSEGAMLKETRIYTDFYGRAFQLCFASKGADGHGGGESPQHLSQFMSSSQDTPFQIYRFSSGVSRIVLRARVLGEDYE